MKRLWVGLVLLLGLPAAGFGIWSALDGVHEPIGIRLEAAAEEALAGDWAAGVELADQARSEWERTRGFTAALANHAALEDIDRLFARLEAYARTRDRTAFAAACLELAHLTRAPAESQQFSWWNLM